MTRRPNPFDQTSLESTLREIGCPDSFISTAVSNFRLFVPLLFAELGEERVYELVRDARQDLGLGEQSTVWRSTAKYLVEWARYEIDAYKARRGVEALPELPELELQLPLL